jgi:hypothetical protein
MTIYWARELIASEVDADSTTAQIQLAALRVYQMLRLQFCAPVGVDAFQALASRALSAAKAQFPSLNAVSVTASGGLRGFEECESPRNLGEGGEIGVILIAQLLRLFMALLGEAATIRLIEDAPLRVKVKAEVEVTTKSIATNGASYLEPFTDISLEADQLRQVSERLEALTATHAGVDEVMSIAGNIRNIAVVLDVFTLIRSSSSGETSVFVPPMNGYLN